MRGFYYIVTGTIGFSFNFTFFFFGLFLFRQVSFRLRVGSNLTGFYRVFFLRVGSGREGSTTSQRFSLWLQERKRKVPSFSSCFFFVFVSGWFFGCLLSSFSLFFFVLFFFLQSSFSGRQATATRYFIIRRGRQVKPGNKKRTPR